MAKKDVPKYVLRALDRRERYGKKLLKATVEVNKYCEKIGLDWNHDRYDDAALGSHVMIFTEPEVAKLNTLAEIERVLEEVSHEG
jgi:hypothetical protein